MSAARKVGFLLQNSPQDRNGFEIFFERCMDELAKKDAGAPWVFLRGDGVYQGLTGQRLDEPGFTVPVAGGWKALRARGVDLYVSRRCAALRGLATESIFVPGARLCGLEKLAELSLSSERVVVL
jgi:sulfur relay (sulfurtransferase) complex TusBCD TusD component (DsrE family)